LHVYAHHVEALALQQQRRHGRIHATLVSYSQLHLKRYPHYIKVWCR
jgi:hypothetical protein